MGKLAISKENLLEEYNKSIDQICDDLEFKTSFTGEEICDIVTGILKRENVENKLSSKELYELYSKKVDNLNLSREEWVKNYGIPEIITIIYEILENNA